MTYATERSKTPSSDGSCMAGLADQSRVDKSIARVIQPLALSVWVTIVLTVAYVYWEW